MNVDIGSNGRGTAATEVVAKAKRRRFSAKYKRDILREYEACTQPGERSALLRREGLYSSHIPKWKEQAERGELDGLSPKKRGPKKREKSPLEKQLKQLERENAKLRRRAERAEATPPRGLRKNVAGAGIGPSSEDLQLGPRGDGGEIAIVMQDRTPLAQRDRRDQAIVGGPGRDAMTPQVPIQRRPCLEIREASDRRVMKAQQETAELLGPSLGSGPGQQLHHDDVRRQ